LVPAFSEPTSDLRSLWFNGAPNHHQKIVPSSSAAVSAIESLNAPKATHHFWKTWLLAVSYFKALQLSSDF